MSADVAKTCTSLHTLFIEQPACCLEVSPVDASVIVVGTYFLDAEVQQRSGSLILLNARDSCLGKAVARDVDGAVLDLHFRPQKENEIGLALAIGQLEIWTLEKNELQKSRSLQLFNPSTLVTGFAWHPENKEYVCCSLSTGQVAIVDIESETVNYVFEHSLEAWVVAWNIPSSDLLSCWSGGDDGRIQFCNREDRRIHGAGVTAIVPLLPNLVITGSYDDEIRVVEYTEPQAGRRQYNVLAEKRLGGGVWKIKVARRTETESRTVWLLLVCCMYAGAVLIEISREKEASSAWHIHQVAEFKEHESMCYGGDVLFVQPSSTCDSPATNLTAVTCSFYDKRISLWAYP